MGRGGAKERTGAGARKRELAQGREREKWRRGAKERNGEGREKRANGDTGAATLNPAIGDIEI